MDLKECRAEIDQIDKQLVELYQKRMETAAEIAAYKKEHDLPILDQKREREKISSILPLVSEDLQSSTACLYSLIFELSRAYQGRILQLGGDLPKKIEQVVNSTPRLFPEKAVVACQGVEGAFSQLACERLFQLPNIFYFSSFDAVFSAIEKGLCKYGIVPLENSTAGSVNAVYDLMRKRQFYIVRSVRLKIDHNLMALPGAKLDEICEIYSHEQAIAQCSGFLSALKNVKIIPCANTAEAAQKVAQSGRKDIAAICSRSCAELYNLTALQENVQNEGNNSTRFICITKDLEIYPGADRSSLMVTLAHKPGSLYQVLARFNSLGINLNKLESRPIPERNFEFMFYFDVEASVYSPQFAQLMAELPSMCEEFHYLGSYSEVI